MRIDSEDSCSASRSIPGEGIGPNACQYTLNCRQPPREAATVGRRTCVFFLGFWHNIPISGENSGLEVRILCTPLATSDYVILFSPKYTSDWRWRGRSPSPPISVQLGCAPG